MTRSRDKKKKREEKVRKKIEQRRLLWREKRKEDRLERIKEIREMGEEEKAEIAKKLISGEYRPLPVRSLLPGPNKPCLCGSKKKFKKCCERDILSGKIRVVAQEDPTLQTKSHTPTLPEKGESRVEPEPQPEGKSDLKS